jgi:hypothetical protein
LTVIGVLKNRKRGLDSLLTGLSNGTLPFVFNKGSMGGGSLAEGHKQWAAKVGFADLDRSTPGYLPLQAKSALAGGPISPLAHDDSLMRGEFPPRRANSGLVEDPGFAPRGLFELPELPKLKGGAVQRIGRTP